MNKSFQFWLVLLTSISVCVIQMFSFSNRIVVLVIVNQTYNELALAGNDKVLSVGVSSNPELTGSQITWMRGDHLTIINGSKYLITFNPANVFLTIFDVTLDDADTYILSVTNDVVGETLSVEVQLAVQGEF